MSDTATITPKELAELLGTDPKTVRRFLRSLISEDDRPGKGSRWTIQADAVKELTKKFEAYSNRTSRVITVDDLVDEEDEVEEDEDLEEV